MDKSDILEAMLLHHSVRNFSNKSIETEKLNVILKSINQAPTSINGQAITVLNIEDKSLRTEIAKLSANQQYIIDCPTFLVFVIDFNKSKIACEKHNKNLKIHESVESLLVGSVDVGIALGMATTLAEQQGLFTCAIGAVRQNPEEMAQLLNLPPLTLACVGLCVGYPQGELPPVKPKMPHDGYILKNQYNNDIVTQNLEKYDEEIMKPYFAKRNEQGVTWSTKIANIYSTVYYPKVAPFV